MIDNKNTEKNSEFDKALVIAITGGISSGKTEVGKILARKNFPVISTDFIAKNIMMTNSDVKSNIIRKLGENSYFQDGNLNTSYISDLVFNDSNKLKELNLIVHPPVIEQMINEIETSIRVGNKVVFVESALIFEAGLDDGFDYVIVVTANDDLRIERAMKRSVLTREQVISRMKEQISQQEKIRLSDFEIQNNKSITDLENSINFLLPILINLPQKNNFSNDTDD